MNLLYALIYLIQLAIYVCLLILFRVYLFLIFLTKDGARWVSAILLTIAGLVFREPARAILHPALSRVTDPLLARLSQDHPALELYALIAPWRYELILLLVIYLAMILVRWTGHLIRPILAASADAGAPPAADPATCPAPAYHPRRAVPSRRAGPAAALLWRRSTHPRPCAHARPAGVADGSGDSPRAGRQGTNFLGGAA